MRTGSGTFRKDYMDVGMALRNTEEEPSLFREIKRSRGLQTSGTSDEAEKAEHLRKGLEDLQGQFLELIESSTTPPKVIVLYHQRPDIVILTDK